VTLTDERDNKNYEVVKIGGRWIMARNLNYQKGLTWRTNSGQPSTASGQDLGLIGSFWCPGANEVSTSIEVACDVYGALYSWETAMSFDGKGAWTEAPNTYCTGAASATACKANHGRTSESSGREGRGICPPNWHVPTDFEWGVFFDMVENLIGGNSTAHQNALGNNIWVGANAGKFSKSACTGTASDSAPFWTDNATNKGTDSYGFRVLPAGDRYLNGSYFYHRGIYTYFWSSSAYNGTNAWIRSFGYDYATVYHTAGNRSHGLSVRCIRDL
jgi:uncharacterized protein (TIGR02145 family)